MQWSIPFSVLFQEQEYILDGVNYFDYDLDGIFDIGLLWEEENDKEVLESNSKISAENIKKQKIDSLNKTYNENYK